VAVFAAALLAGVMGCRPTDRAAPASRADQDPISQPWSAEAQGREVTLQLADRSVYDQVVAGHRGKVVVVDFWATWCGPCVQEFPHTVELAGRFDPQQVAVISVSMDEPGKQEAVLQFLKSKGAAFDNLLGSYGVGQEGFEAFEITDGSIPHYKIYDQAGKLHFTAGDNKQLEGEIRQLLGSS
jgi:thiol-disulfide isomerase/thioredoxin